MVNSLGGSASAFDKHVRRKPVMLLVEDDEADVLFIERCRKQLDSDVEVLVARDGEEALDMLQGDEESLRPNVIVTDLNMPGMSGHELIEKIRQDQTLSNSVVFVLSSSSLSGDIELAYSYNIAGYITKKASTKEFTRCIEMLFEYCTAVQLPV